MKETVITGVQAAGRILLEHFGRGVQAQQKESPHSIVTEADWASDAYLRGLIQQRYPEHNILTEESGWLDRGSAWTWVIDPLDGTSNFAAGLPWFGVMLAVFENQQPVLGAMYLPCTEQLYFAERGQGAWRNGEPVRVAGETVLSNLLCAYMMDHSVDELLTRRRLQLLGQLLGRVRNTRCTNSLVDFAYTIEGRLGAFINHSARIWDIAAAWLILREAGGRMTDLLGREIQFTLGPNASFREYPVLGASLSVLEQLAQFIRSTHLFESGSG